MPQADLVLLQRYMPLMVAEYERIGMAAEMERYFTGSGDVPITDANCEKELGALHATPSGIGFDAYCARIGIDANTIRTIYEQSRAPLNEEL